MFNLNKVMLAGNLTRDPQVRFLSNEQAVANFGIAINRRFKGNDGQVKEEVTFVDIETWGRTAELAGQFLTKGKLVYLEGRLKLDKWDEADGSKRSKLKVVADSIQFLSPKSDGGSRSQQDDGATGGDASGDSATGVQENRTNAERAQPLASGTLSAGDEPPF